MNLKQFLMKMNTENHFERQLIYGPTTDLGLLDSHLKQQFLMATPKTKKHFDN